MGIFFSIHKLIYSPHIHKHVYTELGRKQKNIQTILHHIDGNIEKAQKTIKKIHTSGKGSFVAYVIKYIILEFLLQVYCNTACLISLQTFIWDTKTGVSQFMFVYLSFGFLFKKRKCFRAHMGHSHQTIIFVYLTIRVV